MACEALSQTIRRYIQREMPNGVTPHVCSTRGPDLRESNDVTFLCFRGWWK